MPSIKHSGWKRDIHGGRLAAQYNGTEVFDFDANDMVITPNTVLSGTLTVDGASTLTGASTHTGKATVRNFALGAGEAVTLVSNVATITKSYVILDAEGAGTTDQLDTLTKADAAAGDIVLLTVTATDTITVDDANINLAAATRAIAPGGSLMLVYDGTEWTELFFTAATDNV